MRETENRCESERGQVWLRQLLGYAVVAFLGFAADYAALYLLERAGLHYLLAAALAFLIGLAVNYVLGVRFVFRRKNMRLALELSAFLLISLVALLLTEGTIALLHGALGLPLMLGKLIAGVLTFLWNFCARRYGLYRKK